jgi:hypothetical protein
MRTNNFYELLAVLFILASGCSDSGKGGPSAPDGSTASGGASAGGSGASGGSRSSGGSGASGGSNTSGGTNASGGSRASGGSNATGGSKDEPDATSPGGKHEDSGTARTDAGSDAGESHGDEPDTLIDSAGLPQAADIPGASIDQKPVIVDGSYVYTGIRDRLYPYQARTDSKGNFILTMSQSGVDIDAIMKLDASFKPVWTLASDCTGLPNCNVQFPGGVRQLAVGTDDSVFVAPMQNPDTVVTKINSTGTVAWTKTYQHGTANCLAAGPDGSLYSWGGGSGQAVGNPAAAANGPVLVRFQSDGTQAFIKQEPPIPNFAVEPPFLVDRGGVAYTWSSSTSPRQTVGRSVSASGVLVDSAPVNQTGISTLFSQRAIGFGPDEKSVYAWVPSGYNFKLVRMALDGTVLWYRKGGLPSATIDPVEGVVWQGAFQATGADPMRMTASKDSIYISGFYQNSYMNGSSPRPTTTPGFVARLDLTGKQIWFQEFQFKQDTKNVDPQQTASMVTVVGADDNPVTFFVTSTNTAFGALSIVKLKKADGTLTPWH